MTHASVSHHSDALATEAEIERQLREWKERMREERSRRLARVQAPRQSDRSTDTSSRPVDASQPGVPPSRTTRASPDAGEQSAPTAAMYHPPASLAEYKREMEELAKPLVQRTSARGVSQRAEMLSRRTADSRQHSAQSSLLRARPNPGEVIYYQARSVLRDYIRRPLRVAREADSSAPRVQARGRTSARAPATERVVSRTRRVVATEADSRARTTAGHSLDNAHDRPRGIESKDWSRSSLVHREAPLRSAEMPRTSRYSNGGGVALAQPPRRTWKDDSRAESARVGAHSLPLSPQGVYGGAWWTEVGCAAAPPGSVSSHTHMTEEPARALFTEPPPFPARASDTVTARPWGRTDPHGRAPASTSSRFQPTIQYGREAHGRFRHRVDVLPDTRPSPLRSAAGGSERGWERWRSRGGWREESERRPDVSVSPPTPSPQNTVGRTRAAVGYEQGSVNTSALVGPHSAAAPGADTSPWSVRWAQHAALNRSDLFRGTGGDVADRSPLGEGPSGKSEASPEPRTVRPHPRPVWY